MQFFVCTGIGYLGEHLTQVHLTKVSDAVTIESHENMWYTSREQHFSEQSFDLRENEDVGERHQLQIYLQLKGNYTFGQLQPQYHDLNVKVC